MLAARGTFPVQKATVAKSSEVDDKNILLVPLLVPWSRDTAPTGKEILDRGPPCLEGFCRIEL